MELPDVTGSGKTKMAARKLEMRLPQLAHKIAMKLQRLRLYFVESSYPIGIVSMLYDRTVSNQKCKIQDGGM